MDYRDFCKKYEIKLNAQQEAAVLKTEGPTLMISVPGSGKTTVITARVGYLIHCRNVSPSEILTVTFSVEAARSMEDRFVRKFGDEKGRPVFRTIHSLSLDIIRTYCRKYRKRPHAILENSENVLRKIIEKQTKATCREEVLKDVAANITKAKNLMYKDEKIADISVKKADFSRVYSGFEEFKRKKKVMDFDDIMIFALQILEEMPDILDYYQRRFRYFNVDEAQDNSLVQNRIIEKLSSGTHNLFMVGDEDQCIYGFRGAYPQAFFEFSDKWGEENIIKLETNYRSLETILENAEKFISQNKNRYKKRLIGARRGAGGVRALEFRNISDRNIYISEDCRKYESAAVLSRNNASLVSLLSYLEKSGVDYSIKGGKNDFFEGTPIMDIIHIIQTARGKGEDKGGEIDSFIKRVNESRLKAVAGLSPDRVVSYIMNDLGFDRYLIDRARDGFSLAGFNSRLNILESISASSETMDDLVENVYRLQKVCMEGRRGEGLSLMTCHGSKGLEFQKVYLIDVCEGIFPSCEKNAPEYEEEVRLFYVGLTRAMDEAEILSVKNVFYGEGLDSEFILNFKN